LVDIYKYYSKRVHWWLTRRDLINIWYGCFINLKCKGYFVFGSSLRASATKRASLAIVEK
jgi:hypothetical protein